MAAHVEAGILLADTIYEFHLLSRESVGILARNIIDGDLYLRDGMDRVKAKTEIWQNGYSIFCCSRLSSQLSAVHFYRQSDVLVSL